MSTDVLHESLLLFLKRRTEPKPGKFLAGFSRPRHRQESPGGCRHRRRHRDLSGLRRTRRPGAERKPNAAAKSRSRRPPTSPSRRKSASRFPFIGEVIASSDGRNLKGAAKAQTVSAQFPHGFIYAGDSTADLHVWNAATAAIFVGRSAAMEQKISTKTHLAAVLPTKLLNFPTLRRGLRFHQWAKNSLVFVPLILGGKAHDPMAWTYAFGAFLALSLLASVTYLLNDLWDLADDRGIGRRNSGRSRTAICRLPRPCCSSPSAALSLSPGGLDRPRLRRGSGALSCRSTLPIRSG